VRRAVLAATLLAAVVWVGGACGRKAPATKNVEYAERGGRFTVTLPPEWRVDETPGEARLASFFGPGTGPLAETITVSFFGPAARWKSPREYAYWRATTGRSGPVAEDASGGARVTVRLERDDPHLGKRAQTLRVAALPAHGGFFVVEDYTDAEREGNSLDVFLAAFHPGKT